MTQITNDYILEIAGNQQWPCGEEIVIGAAGGTTASTGYPIKSQVAHITLCSTANAALVMKSILSNDNPQFVVVVNDSVNTVKVFPFLAIGTGATDTTENINGVATGFSIATLTSAIFIASVQQTKRKGGSGGANTLNWSAATFS